MINQIKTLKNRILINERRILINDIILFILLGIVLNSVVMINNNSKMPIYSYKEVTLPDNYIAFDNFNEVKYGYLGDVFKIKNIWFSLGDVLICGGFISLGFISIKGLFNKFRRGVKNGIIINGRKLKQ